MSDTEEDLEIQQIFRKSTTQHDCKKINPISPVLNSINCDRKALLGRRRCFKNRSRIRTKLADKFEVELKIKSEILKPEILEGHASNKCSENTEIDNDCCFKIPPSPSQCLIFSPKMKSTIVNRSYKNTSFKSANEHLCNSNDSAVPQNTVIDKNNSSSNSKSYGYKTNIDELSLTQEIFDSGITNSQIATAFDDDILNNVKSKCKSDFIGFNSSEVFYSKQLHNYLVSYLNTMTDKVNLARIGIPKFQCDNKYKLDTLFLPPCKRRKISYHFEKESSSNLQIGFSTASGVKINISNNALLNTKHILLDLDPLCIESPNKHEQYKNVLKSLSLNKYSTVKPKNFNSNQIDFKKNLTKSKLKFFDGIINESESENISDVDLKLKDCQNTVTVNKYNLPGPSGFKRSQEFPASGSSSNKNKSNNNERSLITNQSDNFHQQNKLKYVDLNDSEYLEHKTRTSSLYALPKQNVFTVSQKLAHQKNNKSDQLVNGTNCISSINIISNNQQASKNKLRFFDQLIEAAENSSNEASLNLVSTSVGFTTPVGQIGNLQRNNNLPEYKNKMLLKQTVPMGFSTASGKSVCISELAMHKSSNVFKGIGDELGPVNKHESFQKHKSFSTPLGLNSTIRKKRFGGIISCKQIPISDEQLKRARSFFNEDLSALSPIRPFQAAENASFTNTRGPNYISTPNKTSSVSFGNSGNSPITPIRTYNQETTLVQCDFTIEDSIIIITSPTKEQDDDLIENLKKEKKNLEERLVIIKERIRVITMMQDQSNSVER